MYVNTNRRRVSGLGAVPAPYVSPDPSISTRYMGVPSLEGKLQALLQDAQQALASNPSFDTTALDVAAISSKFRSEALYMCQLMRNNSYIFAGHTDVGPSIDPNCDSPDPLISRYLAMLVDYYNRVRAWQQAEGIATSGCWTFEGNPGYSGNQWLICRGTPQAAQIVAQPVAASWNLSPAPAPIAPVMPSSPGAASAQLPTPAAGGPILAPAAVASAVSSIPMWAWIAGGLGLVWMMGKSS